MSAVEPVFNVDRHASVAENVDALGKRWEVKSKRGGGLLFAHSEQGSAIPKNMQGLWTSAARLQTQIDLHLKETWDQAEEAQRVAAGKARRAAELAEAKAEADKVAAAKKSVVKKAPVKKEK